MSIGKLLSISCLSDSRISALCSDQFLIEALLKIKLLCLMQTLLSKRIFNRLNKKKILKLLFWKAKTY